MPKSNPEAEKKLTQISIKNLPPGRHRDRDSNGLYVIARDTGSRQWLLRVVMPGVEGKPPKRHDFGLGSFPQLSLADARTKAAKWRAWARAGRNPVAAQRAEDRALAEQEAETGKAFAWVADRAFEALSPAWRNPKHRDQWISTIREYVNPFIGARPVEEIDSPDIVDLLSPIWLSKPETARRVRQRVAAVLDFAHARGWRSTEAPMRSIMAGKALPRQPKGKEHHAAVPYPAAPATIARLREKLPSVGRLALELAIITATRSGEVRGATWGEVDLDAAIWTIPASRMKAKREHVVPLTGRAVEIIKTAAAFRKSNRADAFIFPGTAKATISDMTMLKAAREVAPNATVHGWRSTFRDWVAERTDFDGDIAEMALAHTIGNKVERAYRRGNLLEKRRVLMEAWEAYLDGKDEPSSDTEAAEAPSNVVRINSRGKA